MSLGFVYLKEIETGRIQGYLPPIAAQMLKNGTHVLYEEEKSGDTNNSEGKANSYKNLSLEEKIIRATES